MAVLREHAEKPVSEGTELTELRTRLNLLKSIATHINSGLNVNQVIARTLLDAHKSLPMVRLSYCTVDDHRELQVVCSVSPLEMPVVGGQRVDVSQAEELFQALKNCRYMAVEDTLADRRLRPLSDYMKATQAGAMLVMPVQHPEKALGFVSMAARKPQRWSPYQIDLLGDMADYLAIAVRDAHREQERQRIDMQMRESQKMEALGRLVGGVAHDFNNLLTGMMIYSGLLATALGKENRLSRHVQEIQNAGERGAALVGQLLALTRQQVLEPKILSLNSVVDEMRDMVQRLIGEEVVMETDLAADLRFTRLDPMQLQQAILNLAINARDAMPGGGKLRVETKNIPADAEMARSVPGLQEGDYVRLRISDNGCGMSEETKEHIFEPFFTTKERGKGSGLGLATVFGMVEHQGGHIAVESALGQGTTFDLFFPVADGAGALLELVAAQSVPVDPCPAILLVEDESSLRSPLAEVMEAEGYRVLVAESPVQAKAMADEFGGGIYLMITDLVMPEMNGRELAEQLAPRRPEMKVLFMSGYTDDPRTLQLIRDGAEYLRKPFTAETLLARVRSLLEPEQASMREQVIKKVNLKNWYPFTRKET